MSPVAYQRSGARPSFRHLVRLGKLLFLRDFRFRYRQAFLRYLWAVARPLMAVLPLILVSSAFGLGGDMSTAEYALFALSGFLMGQVFWDAVIAPQWIARRLRRTCTQGPHRKFSGNRLTLVPVDERGHPGVPMTAESLQ